MPIAHASTWRPRGSSAPPDLGIILRHVLPNVITPAIVFSMTDVVLIILRGSSLSFLCLGRAAAGAGVGLMIAEGADVSGHGVVDVGAARSGDRDHGGSV